MTALRWGRATDVGMVRTNNEDNLLVESPVFAVADGMGGPAAGEVASEIAVATLKAAFATTDTAGQPRPGDHSRDALANAVRQANEAIFDRARQDPALRGMGTTLTAVALVEEEGDDVLAVVNVGDSRAYRMRDGELEQLTDDHSLVEEMVRTGRLSADEASVHPQRHILTRALGVQPDVEVDCFAITPFAGDRYLLASDGLMNEVSDRDIATVLRRTGDPNDAARELVDLAKGNGGSDNITVVIVDVVDDDDRAVKASAAVAADPIKARRAEVSVPGAATAPPPPTQAQPDPKHHPKTANPPKPRRFTLKVVFFLFALIAILAGALFAISAYARGSYYVGLDGTQVVIYQGRPGGLLWFKPTVKQRTDLTEPEIPAPYKADVKAGKEESSLSAARQYVQNLKDVSRPDDSSTAAANANETTTSTTGATPTTASKIP
jgi:protein phosphatase